MALSPRIASCFWIITILTLELVPLSTATVILYYGRNVMNTDELSSIYGISARTCEKECSDRPMCTTAVYHVLVRRCILYKNHVTSAVDIVEETGVVTMAGFRTAVSEVQCEAAYCNKMEACTTKVDNSRECKIKECGKPDDFIFHNVFNGFHLGNRYHVDGRLVLVHNGQHLTTVCKSDGHWSHLDSIYRSDIHDCSDVSSDVGNDAGYLPFPIVFMHNSAIVYCDFVTDGGDWLVFQRRMDGSEDFYRNWANYTEGFGNAAGEFWLGLENLHIITRANSQGYEYELRIDMEDFEGEKRFAQYSTFYIESASDNYRLHVGGYTGDESGDSFSTQNGYQFTTYDSDNDINTANCAELYTGAWWYGTCHSSNLNGVYQPSGHTTEYAANINWQTWTAYYYSLKKTEMKLQRKGV